MEKNNNSTKSSFITQDSDQQAEKIQKHRVAFCIGYIGTGFSGLQYSPTVRTVEGVLEHAIHQAGCISDMNAGQLTKIGWGRCARTDKGVHAAAQVVSLKLLYKDPQTIIERINNHLPPEIRVHDFQKTTARFSAKNWCNGRTYRYLIPLFAFEKGSFAGVSKIFSIQDKITLKQTSQIRNIEQISNYDQSIKNNESLKVKSENNEDQIKEETIREQLVLDGLVESSDNEDGIGDDDGSDDEILKVSMNGTKQSDNQLIQSSQTSQDISFGKRKRSHIEQNAENEIEKVSEGEEEVENEIVDNSFEIGIKRIKTENDEMNNQQITILSKNQIQDQNINEKIPIPITIFPEKILEVSNDAISKYLSERHQQQQYGQSSSQSSSQEIHQNLSKLIDEIESISQRFVGTHNYHNFTLGSARQSWVSCQRIIKKISVTRSLNKPNILTSSSSSSSESSHLTASSGSSENQYDSLVVDGVPMVEIQIVGQSFIFHQIRKMIGTIIAVVRGVAPADFIDLAFSEREVPVPLAPSTGLFLERCHFDLYNSKFCSKNERPRLDFDIPQVEDFIAHKIRPHIALNIQQVFLPWLETLEQKFPSMLQHALSIPAPPNNTKMIPRVQLRQKEERLIQKDQKKQKNWSNQRRKEKNEDISNNQQHVQENLQSNI